MTTNRFKDLFAEADAAFNGKYQKELDELMGLSRDEIDAITPDTTDLKVYMALMKMVEEASKTNMAQAELIENIKGLGEVAVSIAKKVPKFYGVL